METCGSLHFDATIAVNALSFSSKSNPMRLIQSVSVALLVLAGSCFAQKPLAIAHAHNDYEHDRPLLDALDAGFCSVEADIYLIDGQLLVAHDRDKVKPEGTLQKLYLEPLKAIAGRNDGRSIYPGANAPHFYLLIDLKSEGEATYLALHAVLATYQSLLTEFGKDNEITRRAVTVIVSGNRPKQTMVDQRRRFAGYDGRLSDLGKGDSPSLMPWISDNFQRHFKWRGAGNMPEDEQVRLRELAQRTHAEGKLLRLWATPDVPAMWDMLQAAGVDWVNSDRLVELSQHLRKAKATLKE